ncbi:MAG: hypothetical protein EA402_11395 [Planctomycetota bacterium]|nr:MAG: hypothetical protein EA402_11395 [Planctomycetota bacterium]
MLCTTLAHLRWLQPIAACALIASVALNAVEGPERERQPHGQQQIPVTNRADIPIGARSDAEVRQRELWYSRMENREWGPWQRHGITFSRNDAIVWAAPEGFWRIYVRIEDISGLATPIPDAETAGQQSFIVDRTPPQVAITFPTEGAFLRGGEGYDITWEASDPHLHSTPITIRWNRGGDDNFVTVAEHIPNTGSFRWTTPRDMTATGVIQILAWDRAGNRGQTQVGSLVIDALPPSRNILGPKIAATRDVTLSISARDAGPAGMKSVQLWYSNDEGVTWNEGPARNEEPWESLAWRAPADGRFLLNLLATDRSGNSTPLPASAKDAQSTILIDTVAPVITLASPIGVRQAGSGESSLRRIYKPGDRVTVQFAVKDENIGEDAASVQIQLEQGAPWQSLGSGLPADRPFTFAIPDANTDTARIRVQVLDRAGNLGEAIAGETFRIRNVIEAGEVTIELD